jgi:perosamine synthetase
MIPLVAPCITEHDRDAFHRGFLFDLLADGESQLRAFEEEFAEYVGCVGGVAVNSGTNALIVALRAAGITYARIPSFTCRALLDAVFAEGITNALCDNRCDIRGARFGALGDITVVSHMFGTRDGTGVIEDFTLSLGAVQSPMIGVCSFHRDKMISTGRGGMIVAQDESFLARCRELAYYDQPSNGAYKPAFSFGMTAMQAALGRSQLRQLPGFIERRREIAARYTAAFREVGIETPDPDVDSVFFRYIIGVDDPADNVRLLAARGVEAGRGVNPPLHRLLGLPNEQFPGAEECFSKLLSVPCHPSLTDEQVQFVLVQVLEVCAP